MQVTQFGVSLLSMRYLSSYNTKTVQKWISWDRTAGTFALYQSQSNLEGRVKPPGPLFIATMNDSNLAATQNSALISEVLYGVVMWLCKLSIFLLYLRVFSPHRWTARLAYLGIVLSFMVYFSTSVVFAVTCTPRGNQSWLEALVTKRCTTGSYAPGYVQGSFGVFFDLYLFVLPIWPVWQLQMERKKKIAVSAIFATGLL